MTAPAWRLYVTCGVCGTDVAIPTSGDYAELLDKLAAVRVEHTARETDGRCGCGVPHCQTETLLHDAESGNQ